LKSQEGWHNYLEKITVPNPQTLNNQNCPNWQMLKPSRAIKGFAFKYSYIFEKNQIINNQQNDIEQKLRGLIVLWLPPNPKP